MGRMRNGSALLGTQVYRWMMVGEQGRLQGCEQDPSPQNFRTVHKHIRISSITKEPLAELTGEASQIPMVTNLESWYLNKIFPFPAEAKYIFMMLT